MARHSMSYGNRYIYTFKGIKIQISFISIYLCIYRPIRYQYNLFICITYYYMYIYIETLKLSTTYLFEFKIKKVGSIKDLGKWISSAFNIISPKIYRIIRRDGYVFNILIYARFCLHKHVLIYVVLYICRITRKFDIEKVARKLSSRFNTIFMFVYAVNSGVCIISFMYVYILIFDGIAGDWKRLVQSRSYYFFHHPL